LAFTENRRIGFYRKSENWLLQKIGELAFIEKIEELAFIEKIEELAFIEKIEELAFTENHRIGFYGKN